MLKVVKKQRVWSHQYLWLPDERWLQVRVDVVFSHPACSNPAPSILFETFWLFPRYYCDPTEGKAQWAKKTGIVVKILTACIKCQRRQLAEKGSLLTAIQIIKGATIKIINPFILLRGCTRSTQLITRSQSESWDENIINVHIIALTRPRQC